jgi:hypothetical protein
MCIVSQKWKHLRVKTSLAQATECSTPHVDKVIPR